MPQSLVSKIFIKKVSQSNSFIQKYVIVWKIEYILQDKFVLIFIYSEAITKLLIQSLNT